MLFACYSLLTTPISIAAFELDLQRVFSWFGSEYTLGRQVVVHGVAHYLNVVSAVQCTANEAVELAEFVNLA